MKKALLALTTVLGLALTVSGAVADGMRDRRGSTKDAPYERPYSWTGFYVGAHLGGGWADVDWSNMVGYAAGETVSHGPDGFVGGAQFGYNVQFSRNWVAGIEVSYSGTSLSDSSVSTVPALDPDRTRNTDINDLLMITARLGYAWDRWLGYVKGGYAAADIETSSLQISTGIRSSQSDWQNGWVVGAGFEYMLARNITWGVEYNFIDLGSDRLSANFNNGPCAGCGMDTDVQIQTVVGRLNFKFY